MDTSLTGHRCPKCGAALPNDAPLGACPACLFALGTEPASELTDGLTALGDAVSSGAYAVEPARFSSGDLCGPYRIVGLLGRGGMGEVYEAVGADGRRVALKLLRERLAGRIDRERFFREGVLAASVTHRNCVYVYGSDEIDGLPVIVMELAPGGTLKQAIEQFGPRTATQAVVEILQVIAGLEAAAAAGILHRDVKPSNCFIDADEHIKVGDFGLSMSLNAADGDITWKPAFQGTPEFAAPEQLRGEPLDVRADIYSVGATLFFLLTGYSPFGERNIKKLIDLKSTRPVPTVDIYLPGIPPGLVAFVGRCMSPDPERRPQTYADLRSELQPFISEAPVPASMARRFGAIFIDGWASGIIVPLSAAIHSLALWPVDRMTVAASSLAAYSIFERLLGGTPGKLVLGIRVTDMSGRRPSLAQAAARWVVGIGLPITLSALREAGLLSDGPMAQMLIPAASALLLCSAIYARVRSDNAMFHDVLTGTRVVRSQPSKAREERTVRELEVAPAVVTTSADVDRVGPFDVIGKISDTREGDLLLGRDPRLRRFVWIHRHPNAPVALSPARRQLAQPTRLRWLAGEETWDAFEGPDGRAFRSATMERADWQRVSAWLADLSRDFEAAEAIDALPALSLDRLWLLPDGQMVLLDFRAPDAADGDGDVSGSAPAFLARVAHAARHGRVPPRAVTLVTDALTEDWMTIRAAAAILQKLSHQTVDVSRWRRALPIAACALPAIVFATGTWLQDVSDVRRYEQPDAALRLVLDQMESRNTFRESQDTRNLLQAYVAESFRGELDAGPAFWNSPRGRAYIRDRAWIQDSVRWFMPKTPEVAQAARAAADRYLRADRARRIPSGRPEAGLRVALSMLEFLAACAALSFATAFIAAPFLFRLSGQALEDREGIDAAAGRRVARSFFTWSPLLLMPINPWWPIALLAAGAVYAVISPERSIQDRLAGTIVAPR